MAINNQILGKRRRALPGTAWLLGAALALPLAGCDVSSLLEIDDPLIVTPGQLTGPERIPTLYQGAVRDLMVAWSGGGLNDAYVPVVALFSDEMRSSDTFITRNATDRREQQAPSQGNTHDGNFSQLQRARRSADEVVEFILRAEPANTRLAHSRVLSGYTFIAFGEAYCGAVPISTVAADGSFEFGNPLTTTQLFDQAATRFRAALEGPGTAAAHNAARIGLGRALLNMNQPEAAALAVAGVPTTFWFAVEHSDNTGGQQNALYNLNISNRRLTVSDVEGINGLPFRSAMDPRVPFTRVAGGLGNGFDANIPLWRNLRFPNQTSNAPLADGVEARLIEAEAHLRAGNVESWLAIHNALRANVRALMSRYDEYGRLKELHSLAASFPETLAPLDSLAALATTQQQRVALHFRERAFWLYTTGHRMGDQRRLLRQYGFTQAQAGYPSGPHHRGGSYSNHVALTLPFNEQQNPNFDHSMCNPATP